MASELDMQAPTVPVARREPLRGGERISRREFEERFDATDGLKRAELIDGVVIMPPATRAECHGGPHADLLGYLSYYRFRTPGVKVYDAASIRLDLKNVAQPDVSVLIEPSRGGQATLSVDDYLEGGPELAVEVSASTAGFDLGEKLRLYQRNGVKEYIVWRTLEKKCDWFSLSPTQTVLLPTHRDGSTRSQVFPGLWLDLSALEQMNVAAVLRMLDQGMASPEHAAFVQKLAGL